MLSLSPTAARADPLLLLWRTGDGKVRNVVLGRIHNPILLVQIDHRRLNVRMAQHGLDLSDGRAMVQRQRGRRMAERMGRDRPDRLRLGVDEPSEPRLLQMVPHHGLNGTDP